MSSQVARPWLAAAARCARRPPRSPASVGAARHFLRSPYQAQPSEDWYDMRKNRSDFNNLMELYGSVGSTQTRDNTFQPHHSLHRPPSEATLTALVAAGAHLGHSKSLMNPNFAPYAYGERADITIIDLDNTVPLLRRAAKVVRGVAIKGGTVLFVGTRPDLRPVVRKAAERLGPQGYHVGERWLPGTLTNVIEIFGDDVVRDHKMDPDLVVFLNPIPNLHAIHECALRNVPTVGIVDSNVDPRIVMYPIPANDESTRTAELISGVLSIAGREGVALAEEDAARRREQFTRARRHAIRAREAAAEAAAEAEVEAEAAAES